MRPFERLKGYRTLKTLTCASSVRRVRLQRIERVQPPLVECKEQTNCPTLVPLPMKTSAPSLGVSCSRLTSMHSIIGVLLNTRLPRRPSTRSKSANSSARSNDGRVSSLNHVEKPRCLVPNPRSRTRNHALVTASCSCLYVMSAAVLKGACDAPTGRAVFPFQESHFHPANVPGELK